MQLAIDGIVPVLPTPFHANGEIAWEQLPRLIEFAVHAGASAVCLPAYASEFYKLSEQERLRLIESAVSCSNGRIPVIAQVNAGSLMVGRRWMAEAEDRGACAVATAVPRQFAMAEEDLFRFFDGLLEGSELPFLLQDFHPGGATVSPAFIGRLHAAHRRFRFVKLEEPRLGPKIEAIGAATGGGVQVIQGWGGMYMLEAADRLAGIMPGLALADLLGRVFQRLKEGKRQEAYRLFHPVLPQILFSLHNLELYHHAEKRLLAARGVLTSTAVRQPGMNLQDSDSDYLDFLNQQAMSALAQAGFEAVYSG